MSTGRVKSCFPAKTFAFIRPDDGTEDLFVHFSCVLGGVTLEVGQRVEFVGEMTPKGARAVDVRPL
jgi:CspA family cold shock protein